LHFVCIVLYVTNQTSSLT